MSYNLILDRAGQDSRGLMDDLKEVLGSNGFKIEEYRDVDSTGNLDDVSRGKELFISRGNKHFSLHSSKYRTFRSTGIIENVDDVNDVNCGAFGVFANTDYLSPNLFYNQPSNKSITDSAGGACCIPKEDYFDYKIYADKKGWQWFIKVSFLDQATQLKLNFFVMFGDLTEGVDATQGQYTLGSNYCSPTGQTSTQTFYRKDFNNGTTQNPNGTTHPLMSDNAENYNIYYKNDTGSIEDYHSLQSATSTSFVAGFGNRNYAFNRGIMEHSFNGFLGITTLMPFEFFAPILSADNKILKSMGQLKLGVVNHDGIEDEEIRIINNKKIQFFHVFIKREDHTILTSQNRNMGIYIERGL